MEERERDMEKGRRRGRERVMADLNPDRSMKTAWRRTAEVPEHFRLN